MAGFSEEYKCRSLVYIVSRARARQILHFMKTDKSDQGNKNT